MNDHQFDSEMVYCLPATKVKGIKQLWKILKVESKELEVMVHVVTNDIDQRERWSTTNILGIVTKKRFQKFIGVA